MPLLETLVTTVAPSIAKTILKVWVGDRVVENDTAATVIDLLAKIIPDVRSRKEAERQLAKIADRAAETLQVVFEIEGRTLQIDEQETIAKLVASTLDQSSIDVRLLISKDLDPALLSRHFLDQSQQRLSELSPRYSDLFSRVIEEASEAIIDVAQALPFFNERVLGELLRRTRTLVEPAEQALEKIERIRSRAQHDQEAETARFETEYRLAVARNLNRMEIFGVDNLSRTSKSQALNVAYISLDLTRMDPDLQSGGQTSEEDGAQSSIQSVESLLADSKRIVIRGDAGTGKTTLIKWIAVTAAARKFSSTLEEWNDSIPFVIRLRQFGNDTFPNPESFPVLVAPQIAGTMPDGWVHNHLKAGTAAVMIDGVDEVSEHRRNEAREWVCGLTQAFPNARFVVTSRPHAVEANWLSDEDFVDADLQPMDDSSIAEFVDHWHESVSKGVGDEQEVLKLLSFAKDLKTLLKTNHAVRRLAANPLLCAVICALHRDTNKQVPEDRIELYERCCSMLLERRDRESGISAFHYPQLTYREKRALLDDLAYWMIKNEWSEISIANALERFAARIKMLQPDSHGEQRLTPQTILKLFIERSGLVRKPTKETLDFAHRSFQEYMAAQAAVNDGDWGLLRKNAAHSHWREVYIISVGLARLSERNSRIEELLADAENDPENRSRLLLMAAACTNTAVEIDPQVKRRAQISLSKLVPPKTVTDAGMLVEAAGEMAVPFLKWRKWIGAKHATACVRGLAMIGSLEAVDAIAEYAQLERSSWAVQKEIIRSATRIDRALFLSTIAPHIDVGSLPADAIASAFRIFGPGVIKGLEGAVGLKLDAKNSDFSILNHFPRIETIELVGPAFADLRPLQSACGLTSVRITKTSIRDLSPLRGLPNLRDLHLQSAGLDLAQIVDIETITSLNIWDLPVDNLSAVSGLANLIDLDFWALTIDPSELQGLTRLQNLRFVLCKKLNVASLPALPALKTLRLCDCGVSKHEIDGLRNRYPGASISTKLFK